MPLLLVLAVVAAIYGFGTAMAAGAIYIGGCLALVLILWLFDS